MDDEKSKTYRAMEEATQIHRIELAGLENNLLKDQSYKDIIAAQLTIGHIILDRLTLLESIVEKRFLRVQEECSKHKEPGSYWEYRRVSLEDLALVDSEIEVRNLWVKMRNMIKSLFWT